ncbi:MAG: hypothetical protein QF918_13925 [Pirellulaceae bacterium]|jgi:hypothetical protein|nr:hypothetical protein [Pirellulaceae bacterium]MDP6554837.1 hypothetical protein [Pirellulaceae bacterium]
MTNIDQFESVFKSADKPRFQLEKSSLKTAFLITDLKAEEASVYHAQVGRFLETLTRECDLTWRLITVGQYDNIAQLLQLVQAEPPDLICTYRNLHLAIPDFPHSLGVFVDVLTQVVSMPVLLLPSPRMLRDGKATLTSPDVVMAVTDHLTGDHHLVSQAAFFANPAGRLFLTHVEDEITFNRYIETIGKIPEIDTDFAREAILEQLLKEPHDYIRSCREVLKEADPNLDIEELVTAGHRLSDYKRLIDEHNVSLLVMNTKDDEQLAMHGVAYPLAVELRETPLLLL